MAEQSLKVSNLTILAEYSFNIDNDIIEDGISIDNKLSRLLSEKDDIVTVKGVEAINCK